jgi:hypothetical protein
MNITYVARRSLIAGHVAGTEYTLAIDSTTRDRSRRTEKVQQKSLSGRIETLWYYGERHWSVAFVPVRGNDVLALQEFLDSTESGESFTMTLLGETQPPVGVKRVDEGYQWARFMEVGALASDWMQTTIEVVEQ